MRLKNGRYELLLPNIFVLFLELKWDEIKRGGIFVNMSKGRGVGGMY